jgi:hypothetical protein
LFAGAPKDFQMFWVRFMAFAAVKNFVAACVVGGDHDDSLLWLALDSLDQHTPVDPSYPILCAFSVTP